MNAMANQGRSQYPQYQQHQQAFNLDGQQGGNNFRHPGKLVDSKTLQRNRQAGLNGGSGVRVVFLGAPSGRESGGTGVFLPRTFTGGPEHKKKNGELLCYLLNLSLLRSWRALDSFDFVLFFEPDCILLIVQKLLH